MSRYNLLWLNSMADWSYGIVFLGFVTYQLLVFSQIVPNFLGGSFSFFLIATFPILLYQTISLRSENMSLKYLRILWFIFLFIFISYLVYGYLMEVNSVIMMSNLLALLRFIVMYLIFLNINVYSGIVKNTSFAILMVVFIVNFLSPVAMHSNVREFEADLLFSTNEFQVDYQTIGALVLIASLIVSEGINLRNRFFIFLITLFTLLGCGARFELVAFVMCVIFRELKLLGGGRFLLVTILIGMIITLIFIALSLSSDVLKFSEGLRILQIIEDGSIGDRWELFIVATNTVGNNFLFGDYASYDPGAYAHNIISAWVDTGLLGFMVLLMIYIFVVYIIFRYYFLTKLFFSSFPFMVIIIAVLAAIFSKHYTNIYLPIMVGAVVGYFQRKSVFGR